MALKINDIIYLEVNSKPLKIKILETPTTTSPHYKLYIFNTKETIVLKVRDDAKAEEEDTNTSEKFQSQLKSPLAGKVIRIHVKPEEKVVANQPLVVIESMKMENIICAKNDAFIKTIPIAEGDLVKPKQVIMTFKKPGEVDAK
jgi:biotin carboxyl carrier protein